MCVCEDDLIDWCKVEGIGASDGGVPVAALLTLVYKEGTLLRGVFGVAPCVVLNVGPELDVHVHVFINPPTVSHCSYHV